VHVVHGEPESKQEFADHLAREFQLTTDVPGPGDVLEL
jgi:predicted metal-dependent RNase